MRKALVWLTPIVAAGVILGGALVGPAAQAGAGLRPLAPGGAKSTPNRVHVNQKLEDSALTSGFSGVVTVAGFNTVDAGATLTCHVTTCTIDATMAVELLDQSGMSGNQFAICLSVDGNLLTCNYTDVAPLDGFFRTYTTIQNAGGYAVGSHAVQTNIYTTYPAYLAYFYTTYHAYKP
jgi:hypothetical protein